MPKSINCAKCTTNLTQDAVFLERVVLTEEFNSARMELPQGERALIPDMCPAPQKIKAAKQANESTDGEIRNEAENKILK